MTVSNKETFANSGFSNNSFIDWSDAFDNASYVEGSAAFPAQWSARAASFRDELCAAGRFIGDLPYADQARQRLDLLLPSGESKGLVVFVHGGYWHKFGKSDWSHLAAGCLAHDWTVAIPSYRLAPHVRITQITQDIHAAIISAAGRVAGPIRLVGHSAGGHLVTRMLCDDLAMPATISGRLARVVAVSSVFDLRPLQATSMNQILQLDDTEAAVESPALHKPVSAVPVILWAGCDERPEFLRQTRLMYEAWCETYADVKAIFEAGKNHFSVIDALADPQSPLVDVLLRNP